MTLDGTPFVTKKGTTPIQRSHSREELWTELNSVNIRNRQSTRRIQVPLLRRITRALVSQLLHKKYFELGVSLVDEAEITELNETFLRHKGVTDVIALDYYEVGPNGVAGDIFVCVDEACIQAKRFQTNWQSELVRYVVHGVLHLSGYDDRRLTDRRQMKEAEDRLIRELGRRFNLQRLSAKSRKKSEGQRPRSKARAR